MIFDSAVFDAAIFDSSVASAPVASGPSGAGKRTIIRNGRRYRVTGREEAYLVASWDEELRELEQESKQLKKELKAERSKAVSEPPKRVSQAIRYTAPPSQIPAIMAAIAENERQRNIVRKLRQQQREILDEEESIAILMGFI